MKKTLVFNWKNTGQLKIVIFGNRNASLRFTPSISAVMRGLATIKRRSQEQGKDKGNT